MKTRNQQQQNNDDQKRRMIVSQAMALLAHELSSPESAYAEDLERLARGEGQIRILDPLEIIDEAEMMKVLFSALKRLVKEKQFTPINTYRVIREHSGALRVLAEK